ncbi:protein PHLOEM UNLOADING MODULATOR-like isoform X2 [Hordeum vulgare subsp. vulgare]|uniref:protein PHLOEM UNLOADING MODULATOR-like isoform X2 n=1 Tax=Hordeum vulgare subsp. vulgare TaxID=112509 RepID=UPI001D1A55D6|nr:protein PHLOEM UNLOADING MODULATOR-like isoform X2 [Hordeum vulgare subsp. vulgare]
MARPKAERPVPPPACRRPLAVGGLGLAAAAYVGVDYLLSRTSPSLNGRLRPAIWAALALATAARAPFYRRWDAEIRAAPWFLAAMLLMFAALLCEAISVRFVSSVLGLRWHSYCSKLY